MTAWPLHKTRSTKCRLEWPRADIHTCVCHRNNTVCLHTHENNPKRRAAQTPAHGMPAPHLKRGEKPRQPTYHQMHKRAEAEQNLGMSLWPRNTQRTNHRATPGAAPLRPPATVKAAPTTTPAALARLARPSFPMAARLHAGGGPA